MISAGDCGTGASACMRRSRLLFVFQFTFQVKRAQIDPLVMGFITAANWGLLVHFLRGPNWRAFWIGCFAAGLGVITKGVGVLAFFMFAPYLFARWRRWPDITYTENALSKWLIGAAAFVVPVAIWVITVVLGREGARNAGVRRLRQRSFLPSDRRPLRAFVGSRATVLVLRSCHLC